MKRLLVISYHWPPAGGVTTLRALRFVSRLGRHGWSCVVATAAADAYERLDPTLAAEVPSDVEVLRIPAWSPYPSYRRFVGDPPGRLAEEAITRTALTARRRLALWIRANAFVPDAKAPWIRPALSALTRYLVDKPVDAIFTSGPPHTNTEIASRLKARTGLPWLADFQDPWSELGYFDRLPLTRFTLARHRRLERRALERADSVTAASPTWTDDLIRLGARNASFLPWGFDETDFAEWSEPPTSGPWRFCHLGTLGADRDPWPLIAALDRQDTPWSLELAGAVDPIPRHRHRAAGQPGSFGEVRCHGFLPRTEALALLKRSHVAIIWVNQLPGQRGRIPAKIYEAIRSRRPVLLVGDPEGDAARLVDDLGAGVASPPEPAALDRALNRLRHWRGRTLTARLEPFDLERVSEGLAHKLHELVPGS